jgi:hypothetical protein
MKVNDLQKCCLCRKGMAHDGSVVFYRIRVETFGLDLGAVSRRHGFEQMLGAAAGLAGILGPDEDIAKEVCTETRFLCLDCAMDPRVTVGSVI